MARRSISIPEFIAAVNEAFPNKREFTVKELKEFPKMGISVNGKIWECAIEGTRPKRFSVDILAQRFDNGDYEFINDSATSIALAAVNTCDSNNAVNDKINSEYDIYIPTINKDFVPYGKNYDLIKSIVNSNEFFPCYIYGISGVGKTSSIEHACAIAKRPFFRVQITPETIDEDLIGSMKLLNGDTVWSDGPIISAYRCGGVVVLDECDLNSSLMILQPILEKKPFYIKQTGELVYPADGFTVFATGNTKGDGSDPRFIGTTTLNDAFLERFAVTVEQSFLPINVEKKSAKLFCKNNNIEIGDAAIDELMKWVDSIRKTYINNNNKGVYISTRRINFVLKTFKIINDINGAVELATARYSDNEREALMMMWKSVHVKGSERVEKKNKGNSEKTKEINEEHDSMIEQDSQSNDLAGKIKYVADTITDGNSIFDTAKDVEQNKVYVDDIIDSL